MSSRFVNPTTTTLKISHGDTLTVKCRLNTGEERDLLTKMAAPRVAGDSQLRADPFEIHIATVLAYLLDWSLLDDDDTRVEIRGKTRDEMRAVLDQLDPSDFEEIRLAIDAHIAAQARLHAVEKNGQGGESTSPAISPSLDAAAGAMSGSPS